MKYGLNIPGTYLYPPATSPWEPSLQPDQMVRIARKAEELGFDHLGVPEHIIMTEDMVPAMGPRWPHCVTAISFFAGATKTIRITNTICVVPYHNVHELAKMFSTLDWLSGGRLILGLGVGNARKEFAMLNVEHDERGAISDEYIAAMIELWTKERPVFKGKYVEFEGIAFDPKPAQKPYPPIWIGGNSKAAMRRAARVGDGWRPSSTPKKKIPAAVEYIKSQPEFQARPRKMEVAAPLFDTYLDTATHDHRYLEPITEDPQQLVEHIGTMERLGITVTGPIFHKSRSLEEYLEKLERFGKDVMAKTRG